MKPRILLVDDEESICFAYQTILNQNGYNTVCAQDYDTAVELISKAPPPDIVISDIILGKKSGIDLLQYIHTRKLNCPVIMITGEPNIETSAEAVRIGAFDYLPKPLRKHELLDKTKLALDHKKELDQKQQQEQENQQARRNLEQIFQNLQEGIVTVNKKMEIVDVNQAFESICSRSLNDLIDKRFDRQQMNCDAGCIKVLEKALRTHQPFREIQIECRHKDIPEQVVRLSGTPIMADTIFCDGAILMISDITQQTSLETELNERRQFHRMIGKNSRMQEIYKLIENLSDLDSTVLITGETGTGKEMVANAIHHNSLRKNSPFIKVNCSALSENILESELFGHVRGAFTGAIRDKKGRFELADKGTLFLDEISDMSPLVQLKLLRVLQEKEFERVGDSHTIRTDVRIIAAAGSDFKNRVETESFRKDLYYRIKVIDIDLPPLRKRRDDIPTLARHFLNRFNNRCRKQITGFSNDVINAFMLYPWPGNIRELEHAVEHCFVLCRTGVIGLDHLPSEIKGHCAADSVPTAPEADKKTIFEMLKRTDWNKAKAARKLGIGRRSLYRKIEKYQIEK